MSIQKIVTITDCGIKFWLRGYSFVYNLKNAQRFDSATAALAGVKHAGKFNEADLMARCEIQDDPTADGVQS